MTANVNIKRGDLHMAVSTAFNLGRYVLMTGGGDGQPIEITIDLRERPDDMFEAEPSDVLIFDGVVTREQALRRARHDSPFHTPTDDHGPSVPAQGEAPNGGQVSGPYIYEFTLQEARGEGLTLDAVTMDNAPLLHDCKQADWVHVYDRVTRERRTLKRPAADAVLTGLRDVAADLRRQSFEGSDPSKPYDGSGMVKGMADLSPLIVTRDGVPCEDQGAALEEFKARCTRGAPVEPPFGCAALPPVGPDEV